MENIKKKSTAIQFDKSKCIGCTRCVKRCEKIGICHLSMEGVGKNSTMIFSDEKACILCGQCTLVCPVKSMTEQENIEELKNVLSNKDGKIIIVQCAPSVRTSINEGFNMEHSTVTEKKLNTVFRRLGFDKIFDVNFAADITTYAEAEELVERIKNNGILPMFTACCPSWVEYVKTRKRELIPNLTTAFSPQIHGGIAYKTWWAEKNNIDPKNIIVVSIMPCTSKKHEIDIKECKINGLKAVDYVLTVRELIKILKENNITNLAEIEESEADELGEYSGAGAIYGSSGGVMESALRAAYKILTGENLQNMELKAVRGDFTGFKEAEIDVKGIVIKVAVLASPINFEKFIESGKYKEYHYVEVMNCLGGCVNGGGQPLLPMKADAEEELINKRKSVLYNLDVSKVKRNALDNPVLQEYAKWAKTKDFEHHFFHIEHF